MTVRIRKNFDIRRDTEEERKRCQREAAKELQRRLRTDSKIPRDTGFLARTSTATPEGNDIEIEFRAPYAVYVDRSKRHRDFARKAVERLWPRVVRKVSRG